MSRSSSWFILVLVLFIFHACDSKQVFDEYQSLDSSWHKDSIISFKVNPPDTLNSYNLYVNIRNNNDYAYSNLQLIVALEYPNGKTIKDTLEYQMAAPNGEFLGEGFTDVKENKLWYKGYEGPFIFEENGEYEVRIQHAMRENGKVNGIQNLDGIMAVGFRIENEKSQ